jgi:hypothetical protein
MEEMRALAEGGVYVVHGGRYSPGPGEDEELYYGRDALAYLGYPEYEAELNRRSSPVKEDRASQAVMLRAAWNALSDEERARQAERFRSMFTETAHDSAPSAATLEEFGRSIPVSFGEFSGTVQERIALLQREGLMRPGWANASTDPLATNFSTLANITADRIVYNAIARGPHAMNFPFKKKKEEPKPPEPPRPARRIRMGPA